MKIEVKVDFSGVAEALKGSALRQVPFVMAKTVNAIGAKVQDRLKARILVAFDRPTPFTQRGVFLTPATKANPVATVFFPDSQEKMGRATREYIRPGAEGTGARHQKKTEYLLSRMGYLPAGWVTVPGKFFVGGKLDQYGNISGAYYKQIIRALGIKNTKGPAKPASNASRARAANMGVDAEFFAVFPGSNTLGRHGGYLPSGVYRRTGRGGRKLVQYLKFVRKASYKQRLDLRAEALAVINQAGQSSFDDSIKLITEKFRPR